MSLRLYKKGLLGFGKARKMVGMNKWEFHNLLGEEKIPHNYDVDELQKDIKTLKESI